MDLPEPLLEKAPCRILSAVGPGHLQAGNERNCTKFVIVKNVIHIRLLS